MPHVPDLRSHETHDLELVAAHAAGDAVGADLATAESLLAACASCAELHADLRAIAAALPAVPARPRRRDYRITPEQSAALRPTGWRRVLGAFATPKLAFTAPLGTGLAALGIAGLLLTSVPGILPAGTGGEPAVMINGSQAPGATPEVAPAPTADGKLEGAQTPAPGDVTGLAEPSNRSVTAATTADAGPWGAIFGALLAAGLLLAGVGLLARRLAPRG